MWIPRTAEELEQAAGEELLNEKARFEVKRELPASKEPAIPLHRHLVLCTRRLRHDKPPGSPSPDHRRASRFRRKWRSCLPRTCAKSVEVMPYGNGCDFLNAANVSRKGLRCDSYQPSGMNGDSDPPTAMTHSSTTATIAAVVPARLSQLFVGP
jgi:hypothetical protein